MKDILYRLFEHQYLGRDEARTILQNIAEGKYNDSQIASLITVYLMRNISVEELAGFREALLEMRVPVDLSEFKPIDIVGTGGDGKNTFNIITASCNPALKAVAPIRKSLGVRSFFNMLGPLVNPVMPTYQLLGVYNLPLLRLYSYTYQESGTRFAVVHSLDGYDEISLTAEFKVAMPEKEKLYTPEMLGFSRTTEAELDGGETVAEAARIFDDVLNNRATPAQKNCVIANSAFAIQVICPEKRISECLEEAQEALESGKALQTFNTFISLNDKLQ